MAASMLPSVGRGGGGWLTVRLSVLEHLACFHTYNIYEVVQRWSPLEPIICRGDKM